MFREFKVDNSSSFQLSSTSKGNQKKWRVGEYFLKADSMGYESIAEALASFLLGHIEGVDFVDYWLCNIEDTSANRVLTGCYSENFLRNGEECQSFYSILKLYFGSENSIKRVLQRKTGKDLYDTIVGVVEDVTSLDLSVYLSNILSLDAIILNEDRHLNNLCVIKGQGYWRTCPIFDNGLSFLSDTSDYPLGTPCHVFELKVKSRPFATDFIKQWKYTIQKPLIIDFDAVKTDIENCYVEFKMAEFERAKTVLFDRLMRLEGKVWKRKM